MLKKLVHFALWEEVQILSFLCGATSLYLVLQLILRYILKLVLAVSQGTLCQKTSACKMSSMWVDFPNYHSGICLFETALLHLFAWLNISSLPAGRNKFVFKSKAHMCMSVSQKKPVCNCLPCTDKYQDKPYNLFFFSRSEMFIEKECALCVFITSLNEGGFNEIIYVKGLLLWVFPCLPFSIFLCSKESSSTSFTDPWGACDICCNPFPPPTAFNSILPTAWHCSRHGRTKTRWSHKDSGALHALFVLAPVAYGCYLSPILLFFQLVQLSKDG